MAIHGEGFTENGKEYTWDIAGHGTRGDWHNGPPSMDTLHNHIADADWGFTVHWQVNGIDHYAFIHGGYDIDELDNVIEHYVNDPNGSPMLPR